MLKKIILTILFLSVPTAWIYAAVVNWGGNTFTGLSSDSKPNTVTGSRFFELDTNKIYTRNSGTWNEVQTQTHGNERHSESYVTSSGVSSQISLSVDGVLSKISHTHLYSSIVGTPPQNIGTLFDYDRGPHSIYSATSSTGLPWTSNPLGEYTLWTTTIPGGSMGNSGSLLIDFFVSMSTVTVSRATRIYFGNQNIASLGINHSTTKYASISGTKKIVNLTSQSQVAPGLNTWALYGGADTARKSNYSIDTTVDQTLKITAQQQALSVPITISAVTGNGSVCTVSATAHGYAQGEYIQSAGGSNCSTSGNPNADPVQLITSATNTFTYACSCNGTESGTNPTIKLYPNITLEWVDVEIKRP